MSVCFKPLSADCINYYDFSPERMAALSYFAADRIDPEVYAVMNFASPIGILRPETAQTYILSPVDGLGEFTPCQKVIKGFDLLSPGAMKKVVKDLARETQRPADTKNVLPRVYSSLLNLDRQVFGGETVKLIIDIDDRHVDPDTTKAPFWHFDYADGQYRPEPTGPLLAQELSPLVRAYVFRVVLPDCTENIQTEYIDAHHLCDKGRPHPLLLEALRQTHEGLDIRNQFTNTNYSIGQTIAANKAFANEWRRIKEERAALDDKMRAEGLIQQAAPNEVLLSSNYTFHRSYLAKERTRSGFFIMRIGPVATNG